MAASGINTGDTAWLLVSTALVMLMTPGLALFYGGMVQRKNVLSTFMHSFFALGLVTRAVGASSATRWRSARRTAAHRRLRLRRSATASAIGAQDASSTVPHLAFMVYQMHVRGDHAGADLGRVRRAHEVLGVRAVHARCGRRSSTIRSRTGCGAPDGWLVKLRRARLRRRHGRAPVVGHLGARRARSCSASASAIRRAATRRTT